MNGTMFVLDDEAVVSHSRLMEIGSRSRELSHVGQRTRAMILLSGETISTPWISMGAEPMITYEFYRGLPNISADGLDASVYIERRDGRRQLVAMHHLDNDMPTAGRVSCEMRIPVKAGEEFRISVACGAGPTGDPKGDWLAVSMLSVAPWESLALAKASSNKAWRLANEIAHFESVYNKDFYRDRQVSRAGATVGPIRKLGAARLGSRMEADWAASIIERVEPQKDENAFSYSLRLLDALLPMRPPNFVQRLRDLHARDPERRVRMLSLCAGEASVEGWILEAAGVPVELCLLDVNEALLDTASSRMPSNVAVDRVLGDANNLSGQLGTFDVINITSGLHHLVELEKVLSGISRSLNPDGEFWLIGEQVGRNGNRLWPEALREANSLFAEWPDAKRRNANTGSIDHTIPDVDYSSGCFEGIRSEDILPLLQRFFLPVNVYVRNCFLWRLFDVAYASNFDFTTSFDRHLLKKAVLSEYLHWIDGGRGTELHAVYRCKFSK
jgi:SAM-dependent methyltransferase